MKNVYVFHGLRGGIDFPIEPRSKKMADFGGGFYCGSNPTQTKSWIANDIKPMFYEMKLNLSEIEENQIVFLDNEDWLFTILYNRNYLQELYGTSFYNKYEHILDNKDIVIGEIADDSMQEMIKGFLNNEITDVVLFEVLKSVSIGTQYVAKTQDGCNAIQVISEKELSGLEQMQAIQYSLNQRTSIPEMANNIKRKHLREGKYFQEIMENVKAVENGQEYDEIGQ